jgi:hypothetical protein
MVELYLQSPICVHGILKHRDFTCSIIIIIIPATRTSRIGWFRGDALEASVSISGGTPDIPTEVLRGLPQSIQVNKGIVLRLGHDRFLPKPFRFILPYDTTLQARF